ncbi:MAG: LytR C-terminal domain-containing protein [Actinomycetota bacterium]
MTRLWIAIGVVALLGALVGGLIAGVPERSASAPDIASSDTTEAPSITAELGGDATTTTSSTTTTPPTTAAPQDSTTVAPTTSLLPGREDAAVIVANGAGIGGLAGDAAEVVRAAGYSDVRTADGAELFGGTVIYFAEGSGDLANRLVDDFSLVDVFVVPIDGAPSIDTALDDVSVLVYLGEDAQVLGFTADE